MKKLLFVLAFVFISTQVQAQLYMVSTTNGPCVANICSAYIYIHTPDGQEIIENLGYLNVEIDNDDWLTANAALHSVLNNIIAEGYKLVTIHSGLDNDGGGYRWHEQVFYLTVP